MLYSITLYFAYIFLLPIMRTLFYLFTQLCMHFVLYIYIKFGLYISYILYLTNCIFFYLFIYIIFLVFASYIYLNPIYLYNIHLIIY